MRDRCYISYLLMYIYIYIVCAANGERLYVFGCRTFIASKSKPDISPPIPPPFPFLVDYKEDLCVIMYQYSFAQDDSMRFTHITSYQCEIEVAANRYTCLPDRAPRRMYHQYCLLRSDTTIASYYRTSVRAASSASHCRAICASADSDCDRDHPLCRVISYDLPSAF